MLIGLTHSLASYFGDDKAVPNGGKCDHCSYCLTKNPVSFARFATPKLDPARLRQVLNACKDRDDPRLLARLAFGITSPRLTAAKLTKHDVFGTMVDCDWKLMLKEFEKVCDAEGGMPAQPLSPVKKAAPAKKRAYAETGRGSSSKRGRF